MNNNDMKKALAEKLRELRMAHGYTQADVAAYIGIKQQTYAMYEIARRFPASDKLYKLAALYGISVDDLLKLAIPLDDDIFFDRLPISANGQDMSDFIAFSKQPIFSQLSEEQIRLLYSFSKLSLSQRKVALMFIDFVRYSDNKYFL